LYGADIYEMYLFPVILISRSACQRSVTMMTDLVEQAMQQYDEQGCLHEQFVKQAKTTPDAIAVVSHTGHKVTKKKKGGAIYCFAFKPRDGSVQQALSGIHQLQD
jgi:hypothetical protein